MSREEIEHLLENFSKIELDAFDNYDNNDMVLFAEYILEKNKILPTKKETEIEIERNLNELRLNVKESYLKNTMLKGFEIGFQKCFNWVKTR